MHLSEPTQSVILASASTVRADMLRNAGVTFDIHAANVDEDAIRQSLETGTGDVTPSDVAVVLAQAKAMTVSQQISGALVIGADQILVCDGEIYTKPGDKNAARDQLFRLRGKTHSLISAVACACDGEVLWFHEQTAHLTMRDFSNEFLGTYLADAGVSVTKSVGAYQLESLGVQLFSAVEGDYFTVLGLPLLPLLTFLRTQNVILE